MFDSQKPTVMLLGRWQPWHDGHLALFKAAIQTTGQVCIMIRDVGGIVGDDVGAGRTVPQTDNPYLEYEVRQKIIESLTKHKFHYGIHYIIVTVPNIVDVSYGRDVGYTFTQHDLGADIHNISATAIRAQLREKGLL
jgi:nicotinamide mononucleotide adenylyltransferase